MGATWGQLYPLVDNSVDDVKAADRREVGEVTQSPTPDLAALWEEVIASADLPTLSLIHI